MRESNRFLVQRYKHSLKLPIYDIGGGGFKFMWKFPVVTVDITEDADIKADIMDMSVIPDNSVGSVITTDTFEHIKNPFTAIKEIHRILQPGGILILSTVFIWDYHDFPGDYFRFSVPALEYLCSDFEKIESDWMTENAPIETSHIVASRAGVYFVGRKK